MLRQKHQKFKRGRECNAFQCLAAVFLSYCVAMGRRHGLGDQPVQSASGFQEGGSFSYTDPKPGPLDALLSRFLVFRTRLPGFLTIKTMTQREVLHSERGCGILRRPSVCHSFSHAQSLCTRERILVMDLERIQADAVLLY